MKMGKYIVMDIVFYGSSLNYDWGGGTNYQELKKITKWDGRQYVLVSRYALRYSILHWASKMFPDDWKLAGTDVLTGAEKNAVVRLFSLKEFEKKEEEELKKEYEKKGMKKEEIENKIKIKEIKKEIEKKSLDKYTEFLKKDVFEQHPEFDLFGFMIAEGGSAEAALTRVSPVKISHAISLTPTNIDAHTMANLDMKRRAGGSGSNPVTMEEKSDFYIYNVTVDVDRIGKYTVGEHGKEDIGEILIEDNIAKKRVKQLVESILNLKRDIKGRREDLSPWFMILGLYNDGRYETFGDKIRLDRKTHYKVIRRYKKEGDTETIENDIEEGLMPLFHIDSNEVTGKIPIYYRKNFCDYATKDDIKFDELSTKSDILDKVKEFLKIENEKKEEK